MYLELIAVVPSSKKLTCLENVKYESPKCNIFQLVMSSIEWKN